MTRSTMIATLLFAFALAAPSAALEVRVKDVHAPSTNVGASIELRDVLPDRFKSLLDEGRVLHLRLQTELWESRPVWDRLVYPAMIRVLRFARAASAARSRSPIQRARRRGMPPCRTHSRSRWTSVSATDS